ncbi:hypothetical protein F2P79_025205 [Pimephales promelas]|nr:hypothetical protein F2P79_025205 [Pimephales promelas]
MAKASKKRNFTENELEVLLSEVGSESRTVNELKKKWSDIKVEVKRRTAAHRQSVGRTGGGDTLISGIVSVDVGDSDMIQDCQQGTTGTTAGTSTGTHSESAPPEQPEPIQSSVSGVSNAPPSAEARPSGAS